MRKVCAVTSSRADYGIIKPLLTKLDNYEGISLSIIVTGMHLCPEFGYTYKEIESDGFVIKKKIDIQLSTDSELGMSKTMGMALICFSDFFAEEQPDLVIVLGDRFEIAAVCCAAVNQRLPIAHLYGGELTEGAVDDCYRHAITKMSSLHFVSCEPYRRRVIQLGEDPAMVHNVGAMGVENILSLPEYPLLELEKDLDFPMCDRPYAVVTFHPVTTEKDLGLWQLAELMKALDEISMDFLITKANSDAGGRTINRLWDEYCEERQNCHLVTSLGSSRYITALKNAHLIIGNSSSGILEGPACKIPTIDIGDRQKGRIAAESVIHCKASRKDIVAAIDRALLQSFRESAVRTVNPYGNGDASAKIMEAIKAYFTHKNTCRAKKFYDVEFDCGQ